jgi:hypothetical protein
MEARYLTRDELGERLAAPEQTAEQAPRWWHRSVPLGWFVAIIVLGVLGVLFSIGLTLHEAYDAQAAMGESVSPPPFNGLFEAIHGMLANWMWRPTLGKWMWNVAASPLNWMW